MRGKAVGWVESSETRHPPGVGKGLMGFAIAQPILRRSSFIRWVQGGLSQRALG